MESMSLSSHPIHEDKDETAVKHKTINKNFFIVIIFEFGFKNLFELMSLKFL